MSGGGKPSPNLPTNLPSHEADALAKRVTFDRLLDTFVPFMVSVVGTMFGFAVSMGAHDNKTLFDWWNQYSVFAFFSAMFGVGLGSAYKAVTTYRTVKRTANGAEGPQP